MGALRRGDGLLDLPALELGVRVVDLCRRHPRSCDRVQRGPRDEDEDERPGPTPHAHGLPPGCEQEPGHEEERPTEGDELPVVVERAVDDERRQRDGERSRGGHLVTVQPLQGPPRAEERRACGPRREQQADETELGRKLQAAGCAPRGR